MTVMSKKKPPDNIDPDRMARLRKEPAYQKMVEELEQQSQDQLDRLGEMVQEEEEKEPPK